MRKLILVVALVVAAAVPLAGAATIDGSTNLTVTGNITANALTITQQWTLTNGETLDNASDGIVRLTFDDDAATLGQLKLESDNAGGNMGDGDSFLISGIAGDSGGAATTYAEIDISAADVTAGTEDGEILFKMADGANSGTLTTYFTLTKLGVSMENGEVWGNTTDGEMEVIFDDDAAELGKLTLRSSNVAGNMSNNDYTKLSYAANDDAGNETEYAFIELKATDVTNASEDGGIDFNVMVGATPTDVLQLTTTGITVPGILTVAGAANITGIITGSGALDVDSITVDAGAGIDNQAAGALLVGAVTATSVEIADTAVLTDIQGTLSVDEAATFDTTVTITGALTNRRLAVTLDSTTSRVLTSADYGTLVTFTNGAAVAVTLPANGAASGSWIDIAQGTVGLDATAITISAATADTLIGPNTIGLDSVTWATANRIGAYARFWSDGTYWHVLNLGGTTMTYTE